MVRPRIGVIYLNKSTQMTKIKSNIQRGKPLFSALIASSLTAFVVPVRAIDTNFTATSNMTILNGGSDVSVGQVVNATGVATTSPSILAANGSTATSVSTYTVNVTSTVPNAVLGFVNFGNSVEPFNNGDIINATVPTGSSILYTVSGGASNLYGQVASNGKVFLLNPAGITVGNTAVINTAGFYASAIPENISYFIANGTLQAFSATPAATATTGTFTATLNSATGSVFLAGNSVTVTGGTVNGSLLTIATGGTTTLASAAALTVNGNLSVQTQGGNVNLGSAALETRSTVQSRSTRRASQARAAIGARRPGRRTAPGRLEHRCKVGVRDAAPPSATVISTPPASAVAVTSTRPFSGVWRIALVTRFTSARDNSRASAPISSGARGLARQLDPAGVRERLHAGNHVADQVADLDRVHCSGSGFRTGCGTARGPRPWPTAGWPRRGSACGSGQGQWRCRPPALPPSLSNPASGVRRSCDTQATSWRRDWSIRRSRSRDSADLPAVVPLPATAPSVQPTSARRAG